MTRSILVTGGAGFIGSNFIHMLVEDRPDLTLDEMRIGLGFDCSLPTIHLALTKMGFTYKKRRYVPVSRIEMT